MLRFLNISKYYYTIEPLLYLRKSVSLKICYRDRLSFLKFKNSLTQSLANRLVYRSNFQRSYKDLRRCYVNILRANFSKNVSEKHLPYVFSNLDNSVFFNLITNTKSSSELDYTMLWKGSQINAMFNLATKITKKKKKKIYKHRSFYIKPERRILFVWKWWSVFMHSLPVKGVSRKHSLITGLENFLVAKSESHVITKFKYKIYKLYMLRII